MDEIKNKQVGITACLVIRNEAKYIKRCLDSIIGVVDEIIVIHDGDCEDESLKIAKVATSKIIVASRATVMEEHLVNGMKMASYNWFLRIDADEFLSDGLRENLQSLIEREEVSAYRFIWPVWDGERYVSSGWPHKLAFFRLDRISFLGVIHYLADVDGEIVDSEYILDHQPDYDNFSWKLFKTKWRSWAQIQAIFYLTPFCDLKKYNNQKDDWDKIIRWRNKYPRIFMPLDFFVVFFRELLSQGKLRNFMVWKYSFWYGMYRVIVDYYIFYYKKNS